jgi:hypothetical protein
VSHCQEKRYSNPIANRVRRERQRLPTCLLIENASGSARLLGNFDAEAFPIKASDNTEVTPRPKPSSQVRDNECEIRISRFIYDRAEAELQN